MANGNGHKVYRFDGFSLDAEKLMLYSGESEIALPPKVVKTLAVLVESRGEILSKDELIEAVWNDSIVEESNLSQYLYLLRKTLGNTPEGQPYIETLRRRGYRFNGKSFLLEPEIGSENGHRTTQPVRTQRYEFERRGNVVALVDWKEAGRQESEDHIESVVAADPRTRSVSKAILFAAFGSVLLLTGLSAYFWFNSGSAPSVEANSELNILRLTSGIEVVDATISPDGKYFVYHEPDGKLNRMWLQQTGHSTRVEIVPASEWILSTKTFTPDGQFIYFVATDAIGEPYSLYRVPTLGGPVTKILYGIGSGVSFSPDGRQMVFYRLDNDGAKYIIKSSDGTGNERVLYGTTPGYGGSGWSPDGSSIAIALQAKPDNVEGGCYVAVVKQETGSLINFSDEVWEGCGRIEWAPDGRGLYMIATRTGEGMTTRRDQVYYISYPQGRSRKITAEGSRHQHSSLGVTNEGSVLAVPYNRSSQIWAMDPNGESRSARQITTGQNDGRSGIAPLADGRVAYISRIAENLNVWVMNQDGSGQKQLTDNSHPIEELRSGGDGRYIIFAAYVNSQRAHLYLMNTDGTDLRQVTSGEGREVDSSFSNDGKWIAYGSAKSFGTRNEFSLWKQSIDGGERVSLNRDDCEMPHFSPDDKYISCVREQRDILILSSVDGTLVRSFRVPQSSTVSNTLNFGARWTPDGRSVAYIVNEKGVSNIWLQPIDGSSPKKLTNFTNGSIYHFAYSMDGSRLYLARGNQIRDAILISATN